MLKPFTFADPKNKQNMLAIVEIAGKQYKVQPGDEVMVDKLPNATGDVVSFENVLMLDNDGKVSIGSPTVKGAKVSAKIVEALVRDNKVVVFKKKRRKGYKVKNGFRHQYTKISIDTIA